MCAAAAPLNSQKCARSQSTHECGRSHRLRCVRLVTDFLIVQSTIIKFYYYLNTVTVTNMTSTGDCGPSFSKKISPRPPQLFFSREGHFRENSVADVPVA